MTDPERPSRLSSRRSAIAALVRIAPLAGLLGLAVPLVTSSASGAADPLSTARQQAASIEAQIQSTGQQIDALDQRYQAAQAKKDAIDHQISLTEAQITLSQAHVERDRVILHKDAIEAYVDGGSSATAASVFASSQTRAMDSSVYTEVVSGDLHTTMADLQTAIAQLDAQRQTLQSQDAQAAQAVATAQAAYQKAQTLMSQQTADLAQVKGKIASLVAQQRAAQAAAQQAAARAAITTTTSSPAPPPPPAAGGGGAAAVRAAETQLGVPYVWGAESPGSGFDCSGLTAWAWGQAGVFLPHYSGAQMADSTPVPISDLQPGDLLFYGPGGSAHVAMYVGGGEMIEATFPGTVVRIDPVRLGTSFAGAGRP